MINTNADFPVACSGQPAFDNYLSIIIKINGTVVLIGFGGVVACAGFFLCCSLHLEPLNVVLILRRCRISGILTTELIPCCLEPLESRVNYTQWSQAHPRKEREREREMGVSIC